LFRREALWYHVCKEYTNVRPGAWIVLNFDSERTKCSGYHGKLQTGPSGGWRVHIKTDMNKRSEFEDIRQDYNRDRNKVLQDFTNGVVLKWYGRKGDLPMPPIYVGNLVEEDIGCDLKDLVAAAEAEKQFASK
jgi:hypothetical protein